MFNQYLWTIGTACASAAVLYFLLPWSIAQAAFLVLIAHEFGHYFAGKASNAETKTPLFFSLGFLTIGLTKVKDLNDRQILATAISGPAAGLLVALAILVLALFLGLKILVVACGFLVVNEIFSFLFGTDGKKFRNAFKRYRTMVMDESGGLRANS